jgi:hypothetical protein
VGHEGTAALHLANLTVVPVANAPGSIRGGLIEADSRGPQVRPVVGATVQIFANGTLVAQAISDSNGEFALSPVPPGTYTLMVSAAGHQVVQKSVTVGPFQSVSVEPIGLAPTLATTPVEPITFVIAGGSIAAGLLLLIEIWRRRRGRV